MGISIMKMLQNLFIHIRFIALAFLALALTLIIYSNHFQRDDMELHPKNFHVIKLTLGDSFSHMQSQSSYHFKKDKSLRDIDLIVIKNPFIFEYLRPKYGFTLPPGLFLGISINAKHVVSVDAFPHLQYINLEDALTLLKTLHQLFNKSGWQLSRTYNSLDEIKTKFTDTKRAWYKNTVGVQEWSNSQEDEIYIKLKRNWEADEVLPKFSGRHEDYFTVRVVIHNKNISRKYKGLN